MDKTWLPIRVWDHSWSGARLHMPQLAATKTQFHQINKDLSLKSQHRRSSWMVSIHVSEKRGAPLSGNRHPCAWDPSGSVLCTPSSGCSPVSSIIHNKQAYFSVSWILWAIRVTLLKPESFRKPNLAEHSSTGGNLRLLTASVRANLYRWALNLSFFHLAHIVSVIDGLQDTQLVSRELKNWSMWGENTHTFSISVVVKLKVVLSINAMSGFEKEWELS